MKKKPFMTAHKTCTVVLAVLTAIIALAYFAAMKLDFDFAISHFEKGSVAFIIFTAAAVLAVVISAAMALLAKKDLTVGKAPTVGPMALFGAILSVFVGIGLVITELKQGAVDIKVARETLHRIPPILVMQIIGSVLAVFVVAAIILGCMERTGGKTAHRIASILAPVSVNLTMFACYFDFKEPLNGPVRNVTTVVQCAVLLFLLSEMRLAFGGRLTSVFYVFSTSAAASVALGFSVGGILYKIVETNAVYPGESFLRMGLYIAVGCVAIDRLLSMSKVLTEAEASGSTEKLTDTESK